MAHGFTKDYLVKATGETEVMVNGVKQASTSGASIDFSIPSGVKNVKVSFDQVSLAAAQNVIVQLGDAGGIETTGYVAALWTSNTTNVYDTTGFPITYAAASSTGTGILDLVLHDAAANTWIGMTASGHGGASANHGGGSKSLSGELTTIRVTSASSTFDAGSINVQYDNPDLAVSGVESVAAGVTDVFVNGVKQASTSGTEIDFTVPSGVKEIKVSFVDFSTSGSSEPIVQLGDSGGVETTLYAGSGSNINTSGLSTTNKTAGFAMSDAWAAGRSLQGVATLVLHDAATNTWCWSAPLGRSDSTGSTLSGGTKALSGELTTVRITTEGGVNTMDAGSINIQYDNPELDLGSGVISGGVVQTVHTQDGAVATTTTTLPADDTIPQNTEGGEFMTASITPTNTANKLKIEVVCSLAHSTSSYNYLTAALFQDSTADALASSITRTVNVNNMIQNITFTHWMTAGTASSTTFKVRGGCDNAGTTTFNGTASSRLSGGVLASSITITEYKV